MNEHARLICCFGRIPKARSSSPVPRQCWKSLPQWPPFIRSYDLGAP
jgi:hypothetical protein